MIRCLFTVLFLVSCSALAKVEVKLSFLEALSDSDTTSSSRFNNEYESAIETGLLFSKEKLAKCGYKITVDKHFYAASDPLQAKEIASRAQDSWLIVGPRRSDHYLLSVQGAPNTPTLSLMANSSEVFKQGLLHTSMGVSNKLSAQVLVKTALKHLKKKQFTYLTIANQDCIFCLDLSEAFDAAAQRQAKKLKEILFVGDTPDTVKLQNQMQNIKPDVVLLPNYSKSSSNIMLALKELLPQSVYLGGDGWGENSWGFVQHGPNLNGLIGYTARGNIPIDQALKSFSLGRKVLKEPSKAKAIPSSGSALTILKIFDSLESFLCTKKPKTRTAFSDQFARDRDKVFIPSWGIGVYQLKDSKITFHSAESL